jgi:hypothetical protein
MQLSANHMRQSTVVLSLGWTVHLTVLCRAWRSKIGMDPFAGEFSESGRWRDLTYSGSEHTLEN